MPTVALLGLGSLGDCLPLCALASRLPGHFRCHGDFQCVLVTHRSHQSVLQFLLRAFGALNSLDLWLLDIPVLFDGSPHRRTSRPDPNRANVSVDSELDACMSALQAIQPEVLLFNLYSAFGFHLAEVMDIDCACVSPGAPPSVHAAHRVLPKQVLERLEEEDSDDFCADKLTVGDLEHWMLPLFLPHYQRWRLKWGLSPLLVMPGKEYPVRPSVPILYGVSPALLPRPGCWPAKAQVCGFWAFNHVSPHYSPPERLVRFLKSRGECPKRPLFCVGLGSMPDLGLIEDPSSLLNLVAVALKRVGADGVFLAKQADLSTASPRQPRGTTPPATLATPPSLGDCVHPRSKRSRTEGEGGVSVEGARENEGEGEVVGEHKGSLEDTKEVLQEGLDCPLRKMAGNMNPSEPSLDLEGGGCRERNQAGNDLMGMKDECMKEMSTVLVLGEGEFVPHAWLLPWCYGMVHHGGSGTTGAGLRFGVVQVIIPIAFDQFFFAEKVYKDMLEGEDGVHSACEALAAYGCLPVRAGLDTEQG